MLYYRRMMHGEHRQWPSIFQYCQLWNFISSAQWSKVMPVRTSIGCRQSTLSWMDSWEPLKYTRSDVKGIKSDRR